MGFTQTFKSKPEAVTTYYGLYPNGGHALEYVSSTLIGYIKLLPKQCYRFQILLSTIGKFIYEYF
jgi:hypothetical protein